MIRYEAISQVPQAAISPFRPRLRRISQKVLNVTHWLRFRAFCSSSLSLFKKRNFVSVGLMKPLRVFILFLLMLPYLGGCGRPSDSPEDFDQKIKKAQKALEKNYNNPKTHTYLGLLYEKRGLNTQAEKHYRIAIELEPKFSEAMINLGNLYFKEKDYPGAIQTFQMAAELNPGDGKANYLLATVYKEAKQYREALERYAKVLEVDPNNLLAQNFMGVIHYELKEFEKAEEAFKKTLVLDPNFADAYGNLGILYDFNFHDKTKAVEYYERFLNLKKEGENVTLIQELLAKAKQELAQALPVVETLPPVTQQPVPETPAPVYQLEEAKKLIEAKNYGDAKTVLNNYIQQHPGDLEARKEQALLVVKTGSTDEGIQALKEVIRASPESGELWYELAFLYDRKEDPEARHAFEEALRLAPEDTRSGDATQKLESIKARTAPVFVEPVTVPPKTVVTPTKTPPPQTLPPVTTAPPPKTVKPVIPPPKTVAPVKVTADGKKQSSVYFNSGVSYQAKGQSSKAVSEYEKAIQINPYNIKAHYNLGILYKQQAKYEKSIQEYRQVVKLDPYFGKAHYNLGVILKTLGRNQEALMEFKRTVQIDPGFADAHLGLGMIYSQSKKDRAQAVYHYKRYLQLVPSGPTSSKIRSWLISIGERP
jgi:tetratricopeptide (TPR) repeat protein